MRAAGIVGRGKTLKTEAALRYGEILTEHGVHTFGDLTGVLADDGRRQEVESDLETVPGAGQHRVRLDYLWMLVGNDDLVKPDRMVLRWLRDVTGAEQTVTSARDTLTSVAARVGHTAWEVDHAIWTAQRGRAGRR